MLLRHQIRSIWRNRALTWIPLLLGPDFVSAHDPVTTRLTWTAELSRADCRPLRFLPQGWWVRPVSTRYLRTSPSLGGRHPRRNRFPPHAALDAVRGFGKLAADPSLSQEEIQTIAGWVNGGAPEGDPRLLGPALAEAGTGIAPAAHFRLPVTDLAPVPPEVLAGLAVRELLPFADVRLLLQHPNGRLEPLIWLRAISPHAPAIYRFAEPVSVAPGSVLRLWTAPPAAGPPRLELHAVPAPSQPAERE